MQIILYQVDAFAEEAFSGNPAAVCPLADWLPDPVMQSIAMENNLSETAFLVGEGGKYELRWFTPTCEVDLCGHATLASAHVVFTHMEEDVAEVAFATKSGVLTVAREGDLLRMTFPAIKGKVVPVPDGIERALGARVIEVSGGMDLLAVVDDPLTVKALRPNFGYIARDLGAYRGLIVTTSGGEGCDFVSRFFAPGAGIPEDPVTGSAHCMLTPFWAKRLGKTELTAKQLSKRGGTLYCVDEGERVVISGRVRPYLRGVISV